MTKDFVKAASYILSVAVGDGKKAAAKKPQFKNPALWDIKQLTPNQYLSQTSYFHVLAINGDRITVDNSHGNQMYVSKDIIEKMDSGDHFAKEVSMNMTGLADLLFNVGDTVLTCKFKKQPNKESAEEVLEKVKFSDLKDQKKLATLVKGIVEGDECTITGHLVKVENSLGRSTVIDLNAKSDSKFRQIDHRTIEYIIFKNAKYVLKKGAKKVDAMDDKEEEKKGEAKWNPKALAVGNWFSGTSYFRAVRDNGDQYITSSNGVEVAVSKDILEHEMYNASTYAKEEKLSLTKVVKVLRDAYTTAFSICFTCKIDDKQVQEKLKNCNEKDFKDIKKLAKELLTGKETTVIGKLSKTEGNLGRSLVIDLEHKGFA